MCWSPDGKYILTGGQDDLVSIWSLNERQIVARCQGHRSWVTAVAFDPWRCDEKNYRFGSVGDDCKLLLWDFSVGMLHRPKAVSNSTAPFHLAESRVATDKWDRRKSQGNEAAYRLNQYRSRDGERAASSPSHDYDPTQTVYSMGTRQVTRSCTTRLSLAQGPRSSLLSW